MTDRSTLISWGYTYHALRMLIGEAIEVRCGFEKRVGRCFPRPEYGYPVEQVDRALSSPAAREWRRKQNKKRVKAGLQPIVVLPQHEMEPRTRFELLSIGLNLDDSMPTPLRPQAAQPKRFELLTAGLDLVEHIVVAEAAVRGPGVSRFDLIS